MKKQGGFTLVELMVVVSITVLLLAWGVPSFSTWKKKHDIENQMVQLYSDIQFGRMTAYGNKVLSGVNWGGGNSFTSYQIMSDTLNNGTIDTNATQVPNTGTLNLNPNLAITSSVSSQKSVSFDGRGFLSPANPITFSVSPSYGAAIDCVAVSNTRITLGKMNATATACTPK